MTCRRKGCDNPAVRRIAWSPCPQCGVQDTTWYCIPHAEERVTGTWRCGIRGCDGGVTGVMCPGWDKAVARYMETGLIADLDAVRAAVTLDQPPGWDIWGSILQPPSSRPQSRWRAIGLVVLPELIGLILGLAISIPVIWWIMR